MLLLATCLRGTNQRVWRTHGATRPDAATKHLIDKGDALIFDELHSCCATDTLATLMRCGQPYSGWRSAVGSDSRPLLFVAINAFNRHRPTVNHPQCGSITPNG